ncbi:MAG: hypothetical protein JRI39_07750 [Deltaproteobacteria bacterium]|nr:hypothetical protein [Deltaproteobacteria bacterium]
MTRVDCISNRNIRIIAAYVESRIGNYETLFKGLSYPREEYNSPSEFFLNEDEWTTYENFEKIFRRARELVNEPYFFFNCGASCGYTGAWGKLSYFARVFKSPRDGFHRLPFFNKTFNDTKEIRVVRPTFYDKESGKLRVILQVRFHEDFDPNRDYIGDPYLRGIISSIPTLWGLPPAAVREPLNPYDPVKLFTEEPELAPYELRPTIEGTKLTVKDPISGSRVVAGQKVLLIPERVNGQAVYLGRYSEFTPSSFQTGPDEKVALLITRTIATNSRVLLKQGEIFLAPYSILDITFRPFSFVKKALAAFRSRPHHQEVDLALEDVIERLRENVEAKRAAYRALERTNEELRKARKELAEYAAELERRVELRTAELNKAQEELLELNNSLQNKVKTQVQELERHRELSRYLSPRIAERILNDGTQFGKKLKRKFMTVVFSDIRNFSAITDSLEPEEIVQLLNCYHSEMIEVIHRYGGTLNKIMGDGLVIFFGDPLDMDDHADRAVQMAIEMQRRTHKIRDQWQAFGHDLEVGIGINTGYMTVGNIGSEAHKEYTVIGNQVNIAARLEQMAGPGQILVTQRTLAHIKTRAQAKPVGEIEVKGIHNPVKIFEIPVF